MAERLRLLEMNSGWGLYEAPESPWWVRHLPEEQRESRLDLFWEREAKKREEAEIRRALVRPRYISRRNRWLIVRRIISVWKRYSGGTYRALGMRYGISAGRAKQISEKTRWRYPILTMAYRAEAHWPRVRRILHLLLLEDRI